MIPPPPAPASAPEPEPDALPSSTWKISVSSELSSTSVIGDDASPSSRTISFVSDQRMYGVALFASTNVYSTSASPLPSTASPGSSRLPASWLTVIWSCATATSIGHVLTVASAPTVAFGSVSVCSPSAVIVVLPVVSPHVAFSA
ncbi:hypothetical protein DJ73_02130 [Halorubrum sp. Ea1]|nr:hypothetical protein DJ73_02130 [Halorubrum sp. Ea1]